MILALPECVGLSTHVVAVMAVAALAMGPAVAQTREMAPTSQMREMPSPAVVPTDKPDQGLINRDTKRPTDAPTDGRNSQNPDGNPNTSN